MGCTGIDHLTEEACVGCSVFPRSVASKVEMTFLPRHEGSSDGRGHQAIATTVCATETTCTIANCSHGRRIVGRPGALRKM